MERTIQPDDLTKQPAPGNELILLDVRRRADFASDREVLAGSEWHDTDNVDDSSTCLPRDRPVAVSCERGGSVSNRVIDRLMNRTVTPAPLQERSRLGNQSVDHVSKSQDKRLRALIPETAAIGPLPRIDTDIEIR
jgi:rhodanese-related sulfurtransferase